MSVHGEAPKRLHIEDGLRKCACQIEVKATVDLSSLGEPCSSFLPQRRKNHRASRGDYAARRKSQNCLIASGVHGEVVGVDNQPLHERRELLRLSESPELR